MKNFKLNFAFSFLLFLVLSSPARVMAQEFSVAKYDWEKNRPLKKLTESQKKEPSCILYNGTFIETGYADASQLTLKTMEVVHRIVRLNSAEEINKYNKVYVNIAEGASLSEIKARAISPSGKVTELNEKNIKEIKDESETNYKIFAIEGAEAGGEIEYLYKVNKGFSKHGFYKLQFGSPTERVEFKITTPENLVMELKPYNFPMKVTDTTANKMRTVRAVAVGVPSMVEEAFANASSNQLRVEYKLAYNVARNNARMNTWNEAAQGIFQNVMNPAPKQQKVLDKVYKNLGLKATDPDDVKIKRIDNFVRKNVTIKKEYDLMDPAEILQKKMASEVGIMKFYSGLFKQAGVDFQLVYTSNRYEHKFDPEFDSWNFLDEMLFYFPKSGKYLSPTDFTMPYGPAPHYVANNYGLFIKKVTVGSFENGIGEVKFIAPSKSQYTRDNLDITIDFMPDMQQTKLAISKSLTGYYAFNNYAAYPFLEADKKAELVKYPIQHIVKDGKFESVKLLNVVDFPLTDTTYTVKASVTTSEFLESAGNRLLFKIGEVIGPQSELYSEKTRKMEIENDFNRQYNRTISFTVPAGYAIKNPEALKMDVNCMRDQDKIFAFASDYSIEGNKVTVKVHESYDSINHPVQGYEDFRKVINAAADFNKITLILEPIK